MVQRSEEQRHTAVRPWICQVKYTLSRNNEKEKPKVIRGASAPKSRPRLYTQYTRGDKYTVDSQVLM